MLLAALPRDQPCPHGASFHGLEIAPSAVECMDQSQQKSPGTGERAHGDFCTDTDPPQRRDIQILEERSQPQKKAICSGNISAHEYSGANPSKELVSPKPGHAPAAGPQPPARLE